MIKLTSWGLFWLLLSHVAALLFAVVWATRHVVWCKDNDVLYRTLDGDCYKRRRRGLRLVSRPYDYPVYRLDFCSENGIVKGSVSVMPVPRDGYEMVFVEPPTLAHRSAGEAVCTAIDELFDADPEIRDNEDGFRRQMGPIIKAISQALAVSNGYSIVELICAVTFANNTFEYNYPT